MATPAAAAPPSSRDSQRLWWGLLFLRILMLIFSVIAIALLVENREEGYVSVQVFGAPDSIAVKAIAQYKLIAGLKFYVAAVVFVMAYTALQIVLSLATLGRKGSKTRNWIIFIADSAVAYLLVCAVAVATEIAYIAKRGAPAVLWKSVCGSFRHYCLLIGVSLTSSFLCAVAACIAAAISAFHLFGRMSPSDSKEQQVADEP